MTLHCIYRIVNFQTGKVYVGQSLQPRTRSLSHFAKLKAGTHKNKRLQAAYNLYGREAFYFEILEKDVSPDEIDQREIYWIAHFNSYRDGYNNTKGGDSKIGQGQPCAWNGIEYVSIAAAARANNVTDATMLKRLRTGYTCDNDLIGTTSPHKCAWNGIIYPSIIAAAKANGISRSVMKRRLRNGYVCDEDINHHHKRICVWNGIQYHSIKQAAIANGLEENTMSFRVREGYTAETEMPGRGMHSGVSCTWNGVEYPSINAAARAHNVSEATMRWRITAGYTCDAEIYPFSKGKSCIWNNIEYPSMTDAAQANNLSRFAMQQRLKNGYTCDADMIILRRKKKAIKP